MRVDWRDGWLDWGLIGASGQEHSITKKAQYSVLYTRKA